VLDVESVIQLFFSFSDLIFVDVKF